MLPFFVVFVKSNFGLIEKYSRKIQKCNNVFKYYLSLVGLNQNENSVIAVWSVDLALRAHMAYCTLYLYSNTTATTMYYGHKKGLAM